MFEYEILYQNDGGLWVELKDWVRPIINKNSLDETHDESQIFLSCSPIEEPFKPFTKFIINITNNETETLYRVVSSDTVTQVGFNEQLYNHDIKLIEPTKELERYTVDNLSFTNYWEKAFITTSAQPRLQGHITHQAWYNYDNLEISVNPFPLRFSNINSNDTAGLLNTWVARQLSNYSTSAVIRSDISSIHRQNSIVRIPTFEYSAIPETKIHDTSYFSGVGKNTVRDWVSFRHSSSIVFIKPDSSVQTVTGNQEIILSQQGSYKIRFTLNREVKARSQRDYYLLGFIWYGKDEHESDWYSGSTTIFELDFFVTNEASPDISKLSIYDVLSRLITTTPTRYNDSDNLKFILDSSLISRYGLTEAPELILTNKNLWEALLIIGGVINAIPYLKINDLYNWNIIDFMTLSSEEKVADTVTENYINSESTYYIDSYTSSFDVYAENLINPLSTNEGQISEPGHHIGRTLRSEEAEISETSMEIATTYPIYRVNKLSYVTYATDGTVTKTPITDRLLEYALYQTEVSNSTGSGKAVSLCYTQGQKNIVGLQYKVSKNQYADASNKVSIKKVLSIALGIQESNINLLTAKFIVEYVPYLNARIRYFKTSAPKLNIQTSMFNNQQSNVIDTIALGRKMTSTLGRTSNLSYNDTLKVYNLNEIPVKGQRSKDGYFVSNVSTEYNRECLMSTITYTKDYQRINDFINIYNLQRYYEVSEKQSLDRYINTNMFYIFGDGTPEINKQFALNQKTNSLNRNYLAELLVNWNSNKRINASIVESFGFNYVQTTDTTYQIDKRYYTQSGDRYDRLISGIDYTVGQTIVGEVYETTEESISKVYLNSNAISTGNNISIITDFVDNYSAGNQAVPYTDSGTDAKMNRAVPYSNIYGQISKLNIRNVTDSHRTNIGNNDGTMTSVANLFPYVEPWNMPVNDVGCEQDIIIDKDSREVIHINQQHHFLKNDNKLVIGNAMTEKCRYLQETNFKARLVFLRDTIDDYEFTIKQTDVIPVNIVSSVPELPSEQNTMRINSSTVIKSLTTEITSANLLGIISTTNNTAELYIQINRGNDGNIVGLTEDAVAWAIITDTNELIIGKNEDISSDDLYNMTTLDKTRLSITSAY